MQKRILIALIIVFTLSLGSSVFAQTGLGFYTIGGGVGLVLPEAGIGSTLGFFARVGLGTLFMENLAFSGDVLYWKKGEEAFGFDWSWSIFQIMAQAAYYFGDTSQQFRPYAGAGLGLQFNSYKVDYDIDPFIFKGNPGSPMAVQGYSDTVTGTDLGIRFFGGVEYDVGDNLTVFGEGGYNLGGVDYATVRGGIQFKFQPIW
jgi:opacity protein-like surface antigen